MAMKRTGSNGLSFLDTAAQIGRRINKEAIWYEGRCNWVGAMPDEIGGRVTLTYTALGPDLYGGTSGVAQFLAYLYSVTGDAEARKTGLGAIRQALSRVEDISAEGSLGLYAGRVGVAVAAARVGSMLSEDELLARSIAIIEPLSVIAKETREFDLISGRAGAIVGILSLRELLGTQDLVDLAVRLGHELIETAEKSQDWYSWASGFATSGNLTGLSHGAAGAGLAFLELYHATGDRDFRTAMDRAFDYERHLFDREMGNWPDLRSQDEWGGPDESPRTFSTFWCHGAPGIALSRLRAVELLGDAACRAEAKVAVDTTRESVRSWLAGGMQNYSLCHGMAGNAEVLLHAREVLGPAWEPHRKLAVEVAEAGIASYAARSLPWPCGTHEGETPSLFLGWSGIGLFYLRLHDPRIPSVLGPGTGANVTEEPQTTAAARRRSKGSLVPVTARPDPT